jgi:hypothetical protein
LLRLIAYGAKDRSQRGEAAGAIAEGLKRFRYKRI